MHEKIIQEMRVQQMKENMLHVFILYLHSVLLNGKNKLDHCSGKDFMKKFCNDLKKTQRKKLITKKRKNTITRKQSELFVNQKAATFPKNI